MDDFLQDLSSLRWWLGVVVVGVIVGVVSGYSKAGLDRLVRSVSARSGRRRAERAEFVKLLARNSGLRTGVRLEEIAARIDAFENLLFAIGFAFAASFLIGAGRIVLLVLGAFTIVAATIGRFRAAQLRQMVLDAENEAGSFEPETSSTGRDSE
jgi:hypothetical protein